MYLLPTYESEFGELWFKIKYNSTAIKTLSTIVNLNMQFVYDSNYTCTVNFLSRQCGGAVLYTNLSSTEIFTQTIQFKQFSNETYLIYISLMIFDPAVSGLINWDYLNLQFDILAGKQGEY